MATTFRGTGGSGSGSGVGSGSSASTLASDVALTDADNNFDADNVEDALDELVTELNVHINDTTTHGTTGDIVGTTDTQTLTNKTITQPSLTLEQSATPTPTAEGEIWWDTDNNQIKVGDGSATLTFSDDSTLGTMASQDADSVAITGGTIDGTTIGASTPSTGVFTQVTGTNTSASSPGISVASGYGMHIEGGGTRLAFSAGSADRAAITSSGLYLGSSSTAEANLHVKDEAIIGSDSSPGNFPAELTLRYGQGSDNTGGLVDDNDILGRLNFSGGNGASYTVAARIHTEVDGTPGSGTDIPGALVLSTRDDSTSTLREALRVSSAQDVGIGTDAPAYPLDVVSDTATLVGVNIRNRSGNDAGMLTFSSFDGTERPSGIRAIRTGTNESYMGLYVGNGTTSFEAMRIESDGTIGMGNTHSDVIDALNTSGNLTVGSGSASGGMTVYTGSANTGALTFSDSNIDANGSQEGYVRYNHSTDAMTLGTNHADAVTIDSSGNVGFGTSSPSAPVDIVSSSSGAFGLNIRNRSANDFSFLSFSSFDGTEKSSQIGSQRTAANTTNMTFYTGNGTTATAGMTLSSDGNLGVGTSSPHGTLHISEVSSNAQLKLQRTGTVTGSTWLYTASDNFYIANDSANLPSDNLFVLDTTTGNVSLSGTGTGVSSGERLLIEGSTTAGARAVFSQTTAGLTGQIQQGSTGFALSANGSQSMLLETNGSERIRVSPGGNVGINNTAPDTTLHVDGEITAGSDGATSGSVILRGKYSNGSDDTINIIGSNRSKGSLVFGYAVAPSTVTQNAFVSSADNASWVRGALTLDNELVFRNAATSTTTVGNSVTMTDRVKFDSAGNILIGGTSTPTSSVGNLVLHNGTVPTGSATNGVILYSEDVTASAELKVRDEAGNITVLSPHNFSGIPEGPSEPLAWAHYTERDGNYVNVDMLKLARLVEKLTGEKLVYMGTK